MTSSPSPSPPPSNARDPVSSTSVMTGENTSTSTTGYQRRRTRASRLNDLSARVRIQQTKIPETANQDPSIPVLNFEDFVAFEDSQQEQEFHENLANDEEEEVELKKRTKTRKASKRDQEMAALIHPETGLAALARTLPNKQAMRKYLEHYDSIEGMECQFLNDLMFEYALFFKRVFKKTDMESAIEKIENFSTHQIYEQEIQRIQRIEEGDEEMQDYHVNSSV